jgi:predicted ABC-type transport system involved in lysophospholipase L1 biosynthesis ATPase subunit
MHELFFELNRELGMTILIVTHNNELAAQTQRKLRMVDGVIVEDEG